MSNPFHRATTDDADWSLTVSGAVGHEVEWSRTELSRFETIPVSDEFDCVDARERASATYRGVRVSDLLDRVAGGSQANFALVHAASGEYTAAFERSRLDSYVLAVERDGQRIPLEDGGPLRLFPTSDAGDCWQNVKWVVEIELRSEDPTEEATARERTVGA
jgi:DMSO/TMAO reductase YedYZ molybdopterin-dependent catalytic subunit